MAGNRVGRRYKGARHPTMVRFPLDHYEFYVRQAAEFDVPMGDYVACRMAVIDGLPIPARVLLAHPKLLALLPADQRRRALDEISGLPERWLEVNGAEPLPFPDLAGPARKDVTRAA